MTYTVTPITDGELHHAHSLLRRFPNGLTRAEAARSFRDERRARDVFAELATQGIAVINTKSDYSDTRVYRLARGEDEIDAEIRKLRSYRASLDRRIRGLEAARDGAGLRQDALFQEAV